MKKKQTRLSRSNRWEHQQKSPRGAWFISGLNGVRECLASPATRIRELWVEPRRLAPSMRAELVRWGDVKRQAEGGNTPYGPLVQGLAALVTPPLWQSLSELLERLAGDGKVPLLVVLDQLEDPMNLGQILRTCECVGVDAVIVPKDRSAQLTQTVAQISQGAFAWVPVIAVTNLRQALESMKEQGLWILGCEALAEAKPWFTCDLTVPTALVMGAEGKGLRSLTRKTCDDLACLPLAGKINSLNVGAATSAFLFEALRQRQQPARVT